MQPFVHETVSQGLHGVLAFLTFPLLLLLCSLNHRCRRCDTNVSIGTGLYSPAVLLVIVFASGLGLMQKAVSLARAEDYENMRNNVACKVSRYYYEALTTWPSQEYEFLPYKEML